MGTGVQFTLKVVDQASTVLNKITGSLKTVALSVTNHFKGLFSSLAQHIAMLTGINTAAMTAMAAVMGRNAVNLANDFAMARMSFTTFLGSQDKADRFLATLQEFANVTPFEFPQLIASTKQMLAMQFTGDQLIPMFHAIGNAVAGLGGGADLLERITYSMGTIKSRGFFSGEEAREFSRAGINARQMIADYMGANVMDVMKWQEQGKLTADVAIEALRLGMERQFPNMMGNMSGIWGGLVSTLKDKWNEGLRKMGQAALPVLEGAARGLINILNNVFSDENMKKLGDKLSSIFSRDNVLNIVTWFANIYEWGKFVFGKLGEFAPKAIDFITTSFKKMRNYVLDDLMPVLFKLTHVMVTLGAIQLGLNIAIAVSKIAGMIPDPRVALAVLAGGIGLGANVALGGGVLGNMGVNYAEKQYNDWNKKRQEEDFQRELGKKPEINPWAFPSLGAGALSDAAQKNVDTFMSGFDKTFKAAFAPMQQVAANTGMLVQQNKTALSAIFGNGGDRMQAMQTRARFGNLNTRGGGLSVNITVANTKDAENLRYAMQYAASMNQ